MNNPQQVFDKVQEDRLEAEAEVNQAMKYLERLGSRFEFDFSKTIEKIDNLHSDYLDTLNEQEKNLPNDDEIGRDRADELHAIEGVY